MKRSTQHPVLGVTMLQLKRQHIGTRIILKPERKGIPKAKMETPGLLEVSVYAKCLPWCDPVMNPKLLCHWDQIVCLHYLDNNLSEVRCRSVSTGLSVGWYFQLRNSYPLQTHWEKTLAPTVQHIPKEYLIGPVFWFQAITYDSLQWETRLRKTMSVYTLFLQIWAEISALLDTKHRECPNVTKDAHLIPHSSKPPQKHR